MPGTEPASSGAAPRRQEAAPRRQEAAPRRQEAAPRRQEAAAPKVLYAIDATGGPDSPVHDLDALAGAATAAVRAGGGHILDSAQVVFPNGAITLVLVLAESHLSIHTWPEDDMVAIDLFSCGAIDGRLVIDKLAQALGLTGLKITELNRG